MKRFRNKNYDGIIVFNSKSKDNLPMEGKNEKKFKHVNPKKYNELKKIKHFRRKISNFYKAPFNLDGRRWNSVETYFHAMKYIRQYPEIAESFTVQAGLPWGLTDVVTGPVTKMVGSKSALYAVRVLKKNYPKGRVNPNMKKGKKRSDLQRQYTNISKKIYIKNNPPPIYRYKYKNKNIILKSKLVSFQSQNNTEFVAKYKIFPEDIVKDISKNIQKDFYQSYNYMPVSEYIKTFKFKISVAGVWAKFSQNPEMRKLLLATKDLQIWHITRGMKEPVRMYEYEVVRDCLEKFPNYKEKHFISTLTHTPLKSQIQQEEYDLMREYNLNRGIRVLL